ncbi:PpiC-type peptidyl-prolyl cis-trans isomerase [Oscillochloris trichoides DG-6]|uniref:PpiC-type peptidyl-prolyl cis-trans isomerase n=1 Tax=Oscillochloris trichoides DG-6 TaxID=765420 RepID=E1II12_9CHLR|nr:PpiC-type peptidyl-prolyl cis-trans isomerase [Oscillochloris trichoides DG-6]
MRDQRRVMVIIGAGIGLALLVLLVGLSYDRLWIPSRPVAQVGSAKLSRGDYWQQQRLAFARELSQNFQILALFGNNQQFAQQFANQSPLINQQIRNQRSAEVDPAVVGQWENFQLKLQGAAQMGMSVTADEINQAIANDLALIFIPPPAVPVTPTATLELTPTVALTTTAELLPTPTATPSPTPLPSPTPSPTPGGPTSTPEPTMTPLPTPLAAEANTQVGQIVDEIFRRYEVELGAVGQKPLLTKEDFRAALTAQYHEQLLNTRVQEKLVPEAEFTPGDVPTKVTARQILVAVTPPAEATQEQIDALFVTAKARADALLADLRNGADFATLAAEESDDPGSASMGGDLGSFDKDGKADNGATYPPELVAAALALPANTLSEPVRTQFGWHILEVTDRTVPTEEDQLREARTKALDDWLTQQRSAIAVQRFPAPTATPDPGPATATAIPTFMAGPPTPMPTPIPTEVPTTVAPTEAASTEAAPTEAAPTEATTTVVPTAAPSEVPSVAPTEVVPTAVPLTPTP